MTILDRPTITNREGAGPAAARAIVASIALLLLAALSAVADPIPKGDVTIKLEPVASGLTAPVVAKHAGDGSGRLFIVEQSGQIRILHNGVLRPTPFLDIAAKLPALNAFFDERGLLGLAFHPDYETNGRFFVRYSAPRAGTTGEPCFGTSRGCHAEVLAEYRVSAGDPNVADPTSERILFAIDKPQFNHDGGEVAFGPDGFLYFSLGDGGGANDGLADSPPSHGPVGNGQNIDTALGAMLRIDVDSGMPYGVPADNPFVGGPGLDEIYAYGFRNPYRFSFDDGPGGDGRLFLADVGQNLFEEVNLVEHGGNYGWVIREGLHCFDPFNPVSPPSVCDAFGALGEPLIDPIVEYSHPGSGFDPEGGITVIGGHVYRGQRSPALSGTYVFGDFAQQFFAPSGSLYFLEQPQPDTFEARQFQIGADDRAYGKFLKGFGADEDGEVYACGSTALAPFGTTGIIERIVAVHNPDLEIKPGSCPNPMNPRTRGLLPVALVGTEDFDVSSVDLATLRLMRGGSTLAFVASLDGAGTGSTATAVAYMTLDLSTNEFTMDLSVTQPLLAAQTVQHVHGPASSTQNAGVLFPVPGPGSFDDYSVVLTEPQKKVILDGLAYINLHSTRNPGGEIRGQIVPATVAPFHTSTEDVATPFSSSECDCQEVGADGIADLSLKFDTQEVARTLSLDGGSATLQVVGRQAPASVSGKTIFSFDLQASQEVPPATSGGTGTCTVILDEASGDVSVSCSYRGLAANALAAHIHGPASAGTNAGVIVPLVVSGGTAGVVTGGGTLSPIRTQDMLEGRTYVNVHTSAFPGGEIRGQVVGGERFAAEDCVEVLSNGPSNGSRGSSSPGPRTDGLTDESPWRNRIQEVAPKDRR